MRTDSSLNYRRLYLMKHGLFPSERPEVENTCECNSEENTCSNATEVMTDWEQLYNKRFHNLHSLLNIYYYNVQIKKKE